MGKAVIENGIMESYEFTMPGNVKITVEEGVKAFGERCFFEQKKLTKIILPGTLETLDGWCLSGSGIKKLLVPEGTTAVRDHAVSNCRSLKTVWLPSTLTELSGSCFENCPLLEEVFLAAPALQFQPETVFRNCPAVKVILVDGEGEPVRELYTGESVGKKPDPADAGEEGFEIRGDLLSEVNLPDGNDIRVTLPPNIFRYSSKLLKGEESVTEIIIPEGVESLTGWEFAGTGIREIRLPESLKKLDGHVFDGCKELRRVYLPASLDEVTGDVFANCPNLELVLTAGSLPIARTNVFENSPMPWIACCDKRDRKPIIPRGFTVKDGVLEAVEPDVTDENGCLRIPFGVTRIAPECLKDRSEIKRLLLPPGLEMLTDREFSGTSIWEIRLPESLIRLDGHVFENCTELESVVLPSHMTALRGELFHNCPKLKYIFYGGKKLTCEDSCFDEGHKPELLYRNPYSEWHTYLGDTYSDTLFDVEDGVLIRYKGDERYYNIGIPKGVRCITTACFKGMKHIKLVVFPETLRELVGWEFAGTGITEIYFPDSLRKLDGNCFEGCESLQTVYLPKHMTRFGTEGECACFRNCTQLGKIYYASEKVTYFNSAFEGCPHFLFVQKFWDKKPQLPDDEHTTPQECVAIETGAASEQEQAPERDPVTDPYAEEDLSSLEDLFEDDPEEAPEEEPEEAPEDQSDEEFDEDLEQMYLDRIHKLEEELVQQKEQNAANVEHYKKLAEIRSQLVEAAQEKSRMETERLHREECRQLEEQVAELQHRLDLAETKNRASESVMQNVLLALDAEMPPEERESILKQFRSVAGKLIARDAQGNAADGDDTGEGDGDGEV
ncbi:MAG: leucine-rich repeat protein [Oscillospiraceae bacterium]|nr:leucine-rich repeat protein [Oscillospiraceae bacterium]